MIETAFIFALLVIGSYALYDLATIQKPKGSDEDYLAY